MAKDTAAPAATDDDRADRVFDRKRTLGEKAGGLGRPLRDIEGQAVTVTAVEIVTGKKVRALADDAENGVKKGDLVERTAVVITVDPGDLGVNSGNRFFTFSGTLVSRLSDLADDPDAFPADTTFYRRELDSGQKVWDLE